MRVHSFADVRHSGQYCEHNKKFVFNGNTMFLIKSECRVYVVCGGNERGKQKPPSKNTHILYTIVKFFVEKKNFPLYIVTLPTKKTDIFCALL